MWKLILWYRKHWLVLIILNRFTFYISSTHQSVFTFSVKRKFWQVDNLNTLRVEERSRDIKKISWFPSRHINTSFTINVHAEFTKAMHPTDYFDAPGIHRLEFKFQPHSNKLTVHMEIWYNGDYTYLVYRRDLTFDKIVFGNDETDTTLKLEGVILLVGENTTAIVSDLLITSSSAALFIRRSFIIHGLACVVSN